MRSYGRIIYTLWATVWMFCFAETSAKIDLQLLETDEVIRVPLRDKPVLEYVKKENPVPEGMPEHFRRSGYIHPVYSPKGQEVTGDFPLDHPHQHALFFAWTRAKFDGKKVEFWNQAKQLGTIEHREVLSLKRKKESVSFSVKHAFVVGKGNERTDALHEIWTVTIHQTPEDYFLFDLKSIQTCATDKPMILEKYHYGGMALRGASEWLKSKGESGKNANDFSFLTSEGKGRIEGNHSRPNWVSMGGKLDGQHASVTVFGHPKNFRAPQHVRLHPNKPYFCFAPMVEGQFSIKPSTQYISQYRYLITSAEANSNAINKHWQKYSQHTKKLP